ncbi:hypothetical protein GQ53DRAFT_684136 [Thozetella sp. PMI_491]|nr:hypothetical protein GQ53DRAFT_684136 [Thozetella sp. PMI_491]
MMTLMDRLTDKPNWHKKVFDEDIVANWRKEALECSEKELFDEIISKTRVRILSEFSFDFCIRELRAKALHFERTGLVSTLDSMGRAVVKSDTLVDENTKMNMRSIFEKLCADQVASNTVDWHPMTNEMVRDLVHPSLYPFVYGRSHFIQDEVVGVADAIERWADKGTTAPADPEVAISRNSRWHHHEPLAQSGKWSAKYQWLPANVAFQEDGSVRFSSYINNLHPGRYPHVYQSIEKLVDLAIPAWDQILEGCGRKESRFSVPESADDNETEGIWEPFDPVELSKQLAKHSFEPGVWDLREIKADCEWSDEEDEEGNKRRDPSAAQILRHPEDIDKWKWQHVKDAILPEPDNDFEIDYACQTSLREKFKDSGLQVIVKMVRIELTPEKPDFPAGGWHVEGMGNERICATALYYVDCENITPSWLSFRTETDQEIDKLQGIAAQSAYNWLERVYGVDLNNDACLQFYGRVETCEGRLLAFPNYFQHCVAPFSLEDRTKPGHRSFIALWLVDPSQRIVSTANVPPQQLDWWVEATFGGLNEEGSIGDMPPELVSLLLEKQGMADKLPNGAFKHASEGNRLPAELLAMLRQEVGAVLNGVMSVDEAKEHRLRLMEERTRYDQRMDDGTDAHYNFCEH